MPVGKSNPRTFVVVTVVLSAAFMANLDLWIVNVALVGMGQDFHATLSGLSWVVNGYAVTLAAVLVPAGRLGDRIGHRRVFLLGTALFTIASVGCALAPNIPLLVIARVAQAGGAAAQIPTSLALMLAAMPPGRRLAAARYWSAAGALAAVTGPVLGGLLVESSWRWVFLVNLPIGVAALVAGRLRLPHPPERNREPLPDSLGSVLLVIAVGALSGALVEAPGWGWAGPGTLALLVGAVVAGTVFVRRCATHPAPMLELGLLRNRRFSGANLAVALFGTSFAIMLLSNSLWCQEVWHYSPVRTGLAMVPGPAMVPLTTVASARLVRRLGPGPVASIGSLLFAGAQFWRVLFAGAAPDYLHDLLPSMLLSGVGVGLALGTLIAAGATALPHERAATGSAVINSVRQIASALGVALLVTVLGGGFEPVAEYRFAWAVGSVLALVAMVVSALLDRGRVGVPRALVTEDA